MVTSVAPLNTASDEEMEDGEVLASLYEADEEGPPVGPIPEDEADEDWLLAKCQKTASKAGSTRKSCNPKTSSAGHPYEMSQQKTRSHTTPTVLCAVTVHARHGRHISRYFRPT